MQRLSVSPVLQPRLEEQARTEGRAVEQFVVQQVAALKHPVNLNIHHVTYSIHPMVLLRFTAAADPSESPGSPPAVAAALPQQAWDHSVATLLVPADANYPYVDFLMWQPSIPLLIAVQVTMMAVQDHAPSRRAFLRGPLAAWARHVGVEMSQVRFIWIAPSSDGAEHAEAVVTFKSLANALGFPLDTLTTRIRQVRGKRRLSLSPLPAFTAGVIGGAVNGGDGGTPATPSPGMRRTRSRSRRRRHARSADVDGDPGDDGYGDSYLFDSLDADASPSAAAAAAAVYDCEDAGTGRSQKRARLMTRVALSSANRSPGRKNVRLGRRGVRPQSPRSS